MKKLIFCDSFDYGLHGEPLATLADDPQVLRKTAGSQVVEQWGDIQPVKGHSLVHLIALGDHETTGPNRNGDSFGRDICRSSHPTFMTKGALYRNHKADPKLKEGYVAKTAYNEDMGRIELLVAADHDKCADWLGDLEKKKAVNFSMGFNCDFDQCAVCGNKAKTRKDYCDCVKKNASAPYGMGRILPDGRKCFVFNPSGHWNDISRVPIGADAIARDLRKVAALGDSGVMGGAELAESYGITQSGTDLDKVALCRKLAAMEKRIEAIAMPKTGRRRTLSKVAVQELRQLPVDHMLGCLAKAGAVLPVHAFYHLVFGEEDFQSSHEAVEKVAALSQHLFTDLCADTQRLAAVCANTTYDPLISKVAERTMRLLDSDIQEFGLHPEVATARELKSAAVEDSTQFCKQASDTTRCSIFLADQYAAYKIAALIAMEATDNGEALFSATMGT